MSETTSTSPDSAHSVFDRVGGAATMQRVVDELYARAAADPELGPYFHATDLEVQRQKLAEMIGEALGGPSAPWLLGLREAHAGRNISHRHFSLMAAHLIDILIEIGIEPDETNAIMHWFTTGREAVVDEPVL